MVRGPIKRCVMVIEIAAGLQLAVIAGCLADDNGWACPNKSGATLNHALEISKNVDLTKCDANQMALNGCAEYRYYRAEELLTLILGAVPDALGDVVFRGFEASQASWCQYRDSSCAFEASRYAGGSMAGQVLYECLAAYDHRRLDVLGDFLKCPTDCRDDFLYKFDTAPITKDE